eukprot:CAMPEP_0198661542 /NCGR_PEP_ID=MMETSP1467-20131203/42380_1 /TAXON_ID=1462469 /ORGANISM="unid. sp., Strain CCMP2135" /LENGTH=36 /DNA_ID= /DNA_START= /DNA_END= /DNA_ORIENTATION=
MAGEDGAPPCVRFPPDWNAAVEECDRLGEVLDDADG